MAHPFRQPPAENLAHSHLDRTSFGKLQWIRSVSPLVAGAANTRSPKSRPASHSGGWLFWLVAQTISGLQHSPEWACAHCVRYLSVDQGRVDRKL
jgi:hypothetical protein